MRILKASCCFSEDVCVCLIFHEAQGLRAVAQRAALVTRRHCGFNGRTSVSAGERPYCCDQCGKQFTQLNALQRHHRIHTGEKPFMCNACGRTFTDKSTLRRHASVRTAHPRSPAAVFPGHLVTRRICPRWFFWVWSLSSLLDPLDAL